MMRFARIPFMCHSKDNADFLREMFLSSEDADRCYGSLSKLARHFGEPLILTGGIAIGWHLLRSGVRRKRERLNDIDIVVEGLHALRASLGLDFLIAHFHPARERGKILVQLVDEEQGTRIDIFTPAVKSLTKRLTDFDIGEASCSFASAEDLLAKLLSIIYPATSGEFVEPKYVEHFQQLSKIAESKALSEIWREYRKEGQPSEFEEAAEALRRSVAAHPDLLRAGSYSQDIKQVCSWCVESELFPLAPRHKIYEVLGYV
jgi:hypothetical protein